MSFSKDHSEFMNVLKKELDTGNYLFSKEKVMQIVSDSFFFGFVRGIAELVNNSKDGLEKTTTELSDYEEMHCGSWENKTAPCDSVN